MITLKYYKLLKILYNNNLELGLIFSYASGKTLDRYANVMCEGLKRKQLLFIKEPDFIFKARILENEMIKRRII